MSTRILLAVFTITIMLEGANPANAVPVADTPSPAGVTLGTSDNSSATGNTNNPTNGAPGNGSRCARADAYGYCLDASGKRIEKSNDPTPPAANPKTIPEVDKTNK